jgi:sugar/nucleoside kinase (ribokinase family)
MPKVVTVGEPLIQLNAVTTGPLRNVTYFERHVAGSEANVAVGVSKMGLSSGLISRVGDDEFGKCVISSLMGQGVDVSQVKIDKRGFTGVYFIQRSYPVQGKSVMSYYRKGSAATLMEPEDIRPSYVSGAKLLHLTGITPALSESCRRTCERAIDLAVASGLKVSLDTNIRKKLWAVEKAKETLVPMIRKTNILFTDPDDAWILVGEKDPKKASRKFMQMGPSTVTFKLGAEGSVTFSDKKVIRERAPVVKVIDPVGAGDAFAAAFISGTLLGWTLEKSLKVANAAGAMVTTTRGDQENIPTEGEALEFLEALKEQA